MKKELTVEKEQKVKEYWQNQAKEFKDSELATNPDRHFRALEMTSIINRLKDNKVVLDVGCGNGYSTLMFAKQFPNIKIIGVDYSPEMIEYAKVALKKQPKLKNRVSFEVANVLSLSDNKNLIGKFDYVVSERCVINILSWEKQKQAILEMKKSLKKNGTMILCENTQEGLDRLNELRKIFSLFPIQVRWHNRYLFEKELLPFLVKTFSVKEIYNFASLYYIISRVVYAKLADIEKKSPDYEHPINNIAKALPPIGNFSPNHIFVLKNK